MSSSTRLPKKLPSKDDTPSMSSFISEANAVHSNVDFVQYQSSKEDQYMPAIRRLISKDLSEPYSVYVYRYFLYGWPDLCFLALDSNDHNRLIGAILCKLEPHPIRTIPFPNPGTNPFRNEPPTHPFHPSALAAKQGNPPSQNSQQSQQHPHTEAPPADIPPWLTKPASEQDPLAIASQPVLATKPTSTSGSPDKNPSGFQPPMRGYIAMLATLSTHRKVGVAGHLVRIACGLMIEQGADEVAVETEVDNVPSLKLYSRLGFLRSKRLHRYYLNGNDAFRLILTLDSCDDQREEDKPESGKEDVSKSVPFGEEESNESSEDEESGDQWVTIPTGDQQ
ncbi:MAG: N-alpha-acetyltransferase 30 [Alyxoria varia]|nr:MAG: N-alpha-acetyltransferase 30 [Alyxoria varia]